MNKLLKLSTFAISMMTNSQAMQEMYQERDLEYEMEYRENQTLKEDIKDLREENKMLKYAHQESAQECDEWNAIARRKDDIIASQSTQLVGQKEHCEFQLAEQSTQLAEQKEYYESQLAEQAAEIKRLKEALSERK